MLLLGACSRPEPLFQRLEPERTGVDFVNRITENDTFNILDFEYVYNGGGVAVADFNGDGLQDLFFTGNMSPNRLYLNRGDWHFEDVTETAGVAAPGRWCSGVAVTDLNLDGRPDLYVCATTYRPGSRRRNLLFVHQGLDEEGRPRFREMAAAYGLADSSHTTNAAFFDYDGDGDLDCYLLVNEMDSLKLPNKYREKITDGSSSRTDRLLRNDWNDSLHHPVFTDVSRAAGILIEGFGLGLNISDLNRDGRPDIYVTNDYVTNDLLWLNNGDGTFTNRAADFLKHTAHSAMGNDVCDLNNDAWPDIVALDMLPEDNYRKKMFLTPNNYTTYLNNERFGYEYQYVRNVLQIHHGLRPDNHQPLFSDIGLLAGIAATDWSWTPLVADFDNDSWRDLIVTNGFPKDITDHDFIDYHADVFAYASRDILLSKIPS
ncbi:MAG: VCBS repeat-containing protein, partial [Bacteroidetes bacterium]